MSEDEVVDEKITTPGNIPVPVTQCPDCVPGTGYICKRHRGHPSWQIGDETIPSEAVPLLQADGSPIPVDPDTMIVPHGIFGGNAAEDLIEGGLRAIATVASEDSKAEWAEKYGTNFENDIFAMHKYCWCEKDDCLWCSGDSPNFLYKPTGFSLDWYKYIGRSMEPSGPVSAFDIVVMLYHCLLSIYYVESENANRIWRCKKCGFEHKVVEVPLDKLVEALWTHTRCGGHWEIVEKVDETVIGEFKEVLDVGDE